MIKVLESWPLLLCGPMLRRVVPNQVSVFVALKHSREVALTVHDAAAVVARGTSSTLRLGRYLHATVITAVPTSAKLKPGKVYTYDLEFTANAATDTLDTDRAAKTLASKGLAGAVSLLKGKFALGYTPDALPSFALPPARLADLKLAHASCRKAHGPGLDALPILDRIINASRTDPLERPHQLFLTGDQIYADDVAEALLEQLSAIGKMLLGWDEPLPPRVKGGPPPTEAEIAPGLRQLALKPPLTSSAAACHLIRLGEFYAMYLFAWSDALWPEQFTPRPVPVVSVDPGDPFANASQDYAAEAAKLYNSDMASVRTFSESKSLASVRRAMANVPTYMIFDDHEVTDDWYLHREQREGLFDSPLASRLVANGLSAYCVFQGWGNDPDAFTPPTPGGLFLSSLAQWRGENSGNAYSTIQSSVGTASATSPPMLRFDYAVQGPAHDVIVLDTRTRRGYPPGIGTEAPDLVPAGELQVQVTNRLRSAATRRALTVLVSAAPVTGSPLAEWVQNTISWATYDAGATFADRETWLVPSRREGFEALLRSLVPFGSVLILSGDVHYGFTCAIRYWDERTTPNGRAAFVQLVSSALKNQCGLGQGLASLPGPEAELIVGWAAPGRHLDVQHPLDILRSFVEGSPAVACLRHGESIRDAPQWRYAVNWARDHRPFSTRTGLSGFVPAATGWLASQKEQAQEHRRTARNDQLRSVVGNNNVATIRFGAATAAAARPIIVAEQSLWYVLDGAGGDALPYTIQLADLSPPAENERKPGSIDPVVPPPETAERWKALVSFRPAMNLQNGAQQRKFRFQPIEKAWGDFVNLDFYAVRVSALPTVGGVRLDAAALLQWVRKNLNDLVDTDAADFYPYTDQDVVLWATSDPIGAAVSITIKVGGVAFPKGPGTVVVTDAAADHWTFSTAWSPKDWDHPVSGNRRFGFVVDGNSWIFYTQGADRTSGQLYMNGQEFVFAGGEGLWRSFQQKLETFVNDHGGAAILEAPISYRYVWRDVWNDYHRPTVPWSAYHSPL